MILPLGGEAENKWNNTLRVFLYLFGLLYCFMGVAIIADVFMASIEKITSKKKRVLVKAPDRYVTQAIWNPTVANLTLMALGSSAPEILLNVIFIFADGYFQEGLGPSTIVGSAAFNLFCISAVCVICIPGDEVRYIKETPVYCITAFFSIFAYIWLLIILMVISPNIVEVWEGVVTFLFFPVLVTLAYLADRGYFTGTFGKPEDKETAPLVTADMTKQELAALEAKIRLEHGPNLTDAQVLRFIEQEHKAPRSRAQYRVGAIREMTGGRRVEVTKTVDPLYNVMPTVGTCDEKATDYDSRKTFAVVEFQTPKYTVLENARVLKVPVSRRGDINVHAAVSFKTREGTAKAPQDYEHVEGRLEFRPGETLQFIEVPIIDDSSYESDEEFYIDLDRVDGSPETLIGESTCEVVIIDDDEPGVLSFEQNEIIVAEGNDDFCVSVRVTRRGGGSGKVTCRYFTEDDSAMQSLDYVAAHGELVFEGGQMSAVIEVKIKARGRYETSEQFRVIIKDVTGGASFDEKTDGGADSCIMYVKIQADSEARERVDRIMSNLRVNWDKASLGSTNWRDQFKAAIYVNGGDDDDEEFVPGVMDYVLHVLNMPWKLVCAAVPPTDFVDGWVCFCCSLMVIGGVTAIIGDMAGLLGCCMFGPGNDGITAITFVALGTSLPDTFASKTAAQQDPHADACIGNVTGSNSVNVFLGLGLPWMLAAIYWPVVGPNEKWNRLYKDKAFAQDFLGGALVVEDPGLGNSVAVFSCLAIFCMGVLFVRRKVFGGELGGPRKPAIATAVLFVILWCIFVGAYVLMK